MNLFNLSLLFSLLGSTPVLADPCNPQKTEGCVARNPALRGVVKDPLTGFADSPGLSNSCPLVCFHKDGATFSILQRYDNPRLSSSEYILYGKVEADIMGAQGQGIISSFYLQSDDLDEIDIVEVFGGKDYVYQTNYFHKGDITTYGDGIYHDISPSTTENYHRYGVRWTELEIEWTVDGKVVRKKSAKDVPNSPMRVILSLWVGGDETNDPGTVQWAGGLADFEKLPTFMHAKNVYVENYSGGVYYEYAKDTDVAIEDGSYFRSILHKIRRSEKLS